MGIGMPFEWCSNALRSLLEHHIFSQISSRQLAAPHITIFCLLQVYCGAICFIVVIRHERHLKSGREQTYLKFFAITELLMLFPIHAFRLCRESQTVSGRGVFHNEEFGMEMQALTLRSVKFVSHNGRTETLSMGTV